MDEDTRELKPNPLKKANVFSKIFWCWLNPLFRHGAKNTLEVDDLYQVLECDSAKTLTDKLNRAWHMELEKQKQGGQASLTRAYARAFGAFYLLIGLLALLQEALFVVQPLLLGGLLRYFKPDTDMEPWQAYMYALGVGLCAFALTLVHHPYFFNGCRIGMWIRVASCSLIYRKVLKLNYAALGKTTTGQIVNLMTNDVVRFDLCTLFFHYLWLGPLQALVVLVILWYMLGPSCLAGFALIAFLIPIQAAFGKLFSILRLKTAVQTDNRVRIMNELLTAIRVIKMYCWEKPFADHVKSVRGQESRRVFHSSYARAISTAPYFSSAKLIAFLTFLSFVMDGRRLTPEIVFVSIALYSPVRLIMTLFWPWAVQLLSEARISCNRIQEFLLLEEVEAIESPHTTIPSSGTQESQLAGEDPPAIVEPGRISAMNITAAWNKQGNSSNVLSEVSIDVRPGELLAVIGPVGSGKSSLLMTLLGELPLEKGKVKLAGRVAYVAQESWVFSASLRQNVLFGDKYDGVRYQKALKAAALSQDLKVLQDGDQTMVGDRGVSLSGGQKARVSLARALYKDADIYLLDDPLSAVDTAVGRHIFDKCICGVLKHKPRVLVTHQVQYLPQADHILVLKAGEVVGYGTYDELVALGIDFAALVEKEEEDAESAFPQSLPALSQSLCHVQSSVEAGLPGDNFLEHLATSLEKSYLGRDDPAREALLPKPDETRNNLSVDRSDNGVLHQRSRSQMSLVEPRTIDKVASAAGSLWSLGSMEDLDVEFVAPVQAEEQRVQGSVGIPLYLRYYRYGAGVLGLLLWCLLNILAQGSYILCDWWLARWSSQTQQLMYYEALVAANATTTSTTVPDVMDDMTNLKIFAGITAGCFLFGFLRSLSSFHILVQAAQNVHNAMFDRIIRCPVLFFDTNPVGRILNRFAKDTGILDELLPLTTYDFIQCLLLIIGIVLVAGIVNPWVFLPVIPIAIVFAFIRNYYLKTSRNVKRLEATTRSPIFSHLSASLNGLASLRAYQAEAVFCTEFDRHLDLHTSTWWLFLCTSRWFGIRLDILCACFITVVTICSVLTARGLDAGLVGMSVSATLGLMGMFQWAMRQSAELENLMTSAERVIEYSELEEEASLTSSHPPPADWPNEGVIEARDVALRYSSHGPLVLKQLSFSIKSREKVGIVGRTGAGKSSLIAMLFRLAEPTGSLVIDGVDILNIGLHELRKTIAIIPQDPVLFSGTVRRNLDPFSDHPDTALWKALEDVQLKTAITALTGQLDASVVEGGANFSVGQRQLLCLARAILRRHRVMIIDEATANVDPSTDALIQETIRKTFVDCTVLTIAHRLHTIMDSDRVMVLELGHLKEFDKPAKLLSRSDSLFHKMAAQMGSVELERLRELAQPAN